MNKVGGRSVQPSTEVKNKHVYRRTQGHISIKESLFS